MKKLQLEQDSLKVFIEKIAAETEKVKALSQRNDELQQPQVSMTEKLIDPMILKCKYKLSEKHHKMFRKNNQNLEKKFKRFTREV